MSIPAQIREVFRNAHCLYPKAEIEAALDALAIQINNELSEAMPVLLTILKGGIVLTGNLLPRLDFPLEIDNIYATRYGNNFHGTQLTWKYEPATPLKDRIVLVLDDILDLGITLQAIVNHCYEKGAKKVYTAVLLDKKVERPKEGLQHANFVALTVDDRFVFGYGLDYKEYLRNAPGIYEVAAVDQK
jgi:hypoxanthine phosphoribosyltransferase